MSDREELAALRRLAELEERAGQAQPQPSRQGRYADSWLGQGVSGLAQGVANLAGTPGDVENLVRGAGTGLANRVFGTDLQPVPSQYPTGEQVSGWMEQAGAIQPPTDDPRKQFLRRTAESVGAAAIPVGGAAGATARPLINLARGMGAAAMGGAAAATSQQVAPGNQVAELGAELAGAMGPGMISRAATAGRAAQAAREAVPTRVQMEARAGQLYKEAETLGVTASPRDTEALASMVRSVADRRGLVLPSGRVSGTMPNVRAAMRMIDEYAGQQMTPTQMQNVRNALQNAAGSKTPRERLVGRQMIEAFDEWTNPLAPQFSEANALWARAKRAQTLEKAERSADLRRTQFSQSGMENALRTEYRGLSQRIDRGTLRGFSDDETKAIRRVATGTRLSNFLRDVGKHAPTSPLSMLGTVTAPAGIGGLLGAGIGGPVWGTAIGAATGMTSAAISSVARRVATRMGIEAAEAADILVRNGAPLKTVSGLTADQKLVAAGVLTGVIANTEQPGLLGGSQEAGASPPAGLLAGPQAIPELTIRGGAAAPTTPEEMARARDPNWWPQGTAR